MKRSLIILLMVGFLPGCSHSSPSTQATEADITQDIGWPRQVADKATTIVYYQPQVDKWDSYKKLEGRLAFSLTPANGKEVVGVASFKCDTKTDKDARTTYLHDIVYTDVRFPSVDESTAASLKATFLQLMPKGPETISMDRILADLNGTDKPVGKAVAVKNDPPRIFYSASPAILLIVDGDPIFAPVDKTNLQFVVNTNWDLFQDKTTKQFYLLADDVWLTSKNLQNGWVETDALPKDMNNLPAGQNFDDVKKMIPPHAATSVPAIYYSNTPAELLLTEGAPVYSGIPGTQLLYISNSDNDIFIDKADNNYYVLLSGRWFKAPKFGGPWSYAGGNLPADFAKIPEDSPRAHVLASVPGTIEASDAVLLAQIPTTVVVNRAEVEAKAAAHYDGDPKFAPIEGTTMEYATNTQDKVIQVGDLYYMCFQAVWFVSSTPNGPWKTADSVPSVIYTIPPSSPVYNVVYVTQTNPTATTVECSSTAGYLGAFIIGATVGAIFEAAIVYGTGWYYHPYVYWPPAALYPIYRPWPCTYGAGAVYNPWTGGWATGRRAYGPYGSVGTSAWYNPMTGRYGRSASVQGWYGGRSAANTYNPWTGAYGHTSQAHNPYAQWGHSAVSNGSQWARSAHVTTAHGTAFTYQTSNGHAGVVTHGINGTTVHTNNRVYAGHDGNVYKKEPNGGWSEYNNKSNAWQNSNLGGAERHQPATQPKIEHRTPVGGATRHNVGGSGSTEEGLNHFSQSRQRGENQSQRFQSFQRNGSHSKINKERR